MSEELEYDAFIAYAGPDSITAVKLRTVLVEAGHAVFVAPIDLPLGLPWPEQLKAALASSLIVVVLVSSHYDSAHYLKEEVQGAIELFRQDKRRRVLPVYLTPDRGYDHVPYSLRQLQSLSLLSNDALLEVAFQIQGVIRLLRREGGLDLAFDERTIAIVTGCDYMPETFDRPAAYRLKNSIDRARPSFKPAFLRSVIFGDIWFLERGNLTNHPNVISIGSAGVNRLTGIVTSGGSHVRSSEDGNWKVMRDHRRWAVFGDLAKDTLAAVEAFRTNDLPGFLTEVWGGIR